MIIFMQPEALPKEIEVIENYLRNWIATFTIKNAQNIAQCYRQPDTWSGINS